MPCLFLIVLVTALVMTEARNNEARLTEDLLNKYPMTKTVRPVLNDSDVVVVTYSYTVTNIVELDERGQFVTVSGWLNLDWQDQFMVWNASDYGGIDEIKVPHNSIWMPDITLYDNVDNGFERSKTSIPLSVTSNGSVSLATPTFYTAFCKMDVKHFPFDNEICRFKHGSWMYGSHQIDLNVRRRENEQSYFYENGVWDLEYVNFEMNYTSYGLSPYSYAHIIMTIGLSRRFEFYVGNIIAPSILLSFLQAFVFFLPPECGEKISFSITNLLAIVLFQQLIAEQLPPSDETPYIENVITLIICLGCISVVATSIILKLHFGRHNKPVNGHIYRIFVRGLGSALGVYNKLDSKTTLAYFRRADPVGACLSESSADMSNTDMSISQHVSSSKKRMTDIEMLNQPINERKKEEELTQTWIDVARVFDRAKGKSPKLECRWKGPYQLTDLLKKETFRIRICPSNRIKVVHSDQLKCASQVEPAHKSVPEQESVSEQDDRSEESELEIEQLPDDEPETEHDPDTRGN
ncbi:neuronal acetylcholine receptor subunit beta-3-like [Anneissia japonica]|uniref:neuronal acetylcholine receptor subunit beta-3-like n=1 Tax=Anneissia japonica TaxID=1529436 RepID=UPI0014254F11|nr:neuronal acetylcholine receptor subunit beta-3-like [Anneissia japonica]